MSTLDQDLQTLTSKFEEGVSADPTKNMSPEDAAIWEAMNREHGDKFKTATSKATVRVFLQILAGRLTRYDLKLQRKQPNIYRLGHFLKAVNDAEKSLSPSVLDQDTMAAMEGLKIALKKHFTYERGRFDLPPLNEVVKMMDAWVDKGKLPKYAYEDDLTQSLNVEARSLDNDMKALKKLAASIGHTILDQMGGTRKLQVMLGVDQFLILPRGVAFKWPGRRGKANYVEITLNGRDLYDITFSRFAKSDFKKLKVFKDVFSENLVETFEDYTGWYLRLASAQAHQLVKAATTKPTARYEEGVSVDPTKNMSPEDAALWNSMNEEHGDKFKAASKTCKKCKVVLNQDDRRWLGQNTDTCRECRMEQYLKERSKKKAVDDSSRIPDGWDNGQVEGKPKTDISGEEGSEIPDGNGNQHKRAEERITMYAVVSEDGYMWGGTDVLSDAMNRSYWKVSPGVDLQVHTLRSVPLSLAERLQDVRSRASTFASPYLAWKAAQPFARGQAKRLAARAPSGLYGHTLRVQGSCNSCIQKSQRVALNLAKGAYAKSEKVADFLVVHASRTGSLPAQVLVNALRNMGPKFASQVKAGEVFEANRLDSVDKNLLGRVGCEKEALATLSLPGAHFAAVLQSAEKLHQLGYVAFDGFHISKLTDGDSQTGEGIQKTDKSASKNGLYGFSGRVSSIGLKACMDLHKEFGRLTADLHQKRGDLHVDITNYLSNHSKQAGCSYSKLLAASYPSVPRTAQAWLEWAE